MRPAPQHLSSLPKVRSRLSCYSGFRGSREIKPFIHPLLRRSSKAPLLLDHSLMYPTITHTFSHMLAARSPDTPHRGTPSLWEITPRVQALFLSHVFSSCSPHLSLLHISSPSHSSSPTLTSLIHTNPLTLALPQLQSLSLLTHLYTYIFPHTPSLHPWAMLFPLEPISSSRINKEPNSGHPTLISPTFISCVCTLVQGVKDGPS